jgi:glycosyltransferase involved in cell wall biosynthesis
MSILPASMMVTTETANSHPQVSIIVPARNEEASLADCLRSLTTQSGVTFEIIVVDDHSTDRTREIALSFPAVQVIEAGSLPAGWTGKNNAVTTGARAARGHWLLFTDADTVHHPGSLAAAVNEAQRNQAALLSYSPEQIVTGFWEKAVMPVIFAELASRYSPSQVSDPHSPAAAANGQYILVARDAYDAIGGHAAVATSLLEDVELARAVKQSGRRIFFRYGGDAVRTRMYRTFPQLREGWTKNLAILFPSPARLAFWRSLEFVAFLASLALLIFSLAARDYGFAALSLIAPVFTYTGIARAHFSWDATLLAPFGLPLFSYLLLRSKLSHQFGTVSWKGRTYSPKDEPVNRLTDHAPTTAGRSL